MTEKTRQELFDLIKKEYEATLVKVDMEELENIILKDYKDRLIEKMKHEDINVIHLNDIIKLIDAT